MSIGMALPRIEDPDEFAKLIVQQYHLEHGHNDGGALIHYCGSAQKLRVLHCLLPSCAAALKAMEETTGVPFSQNKLPTGSTLLQVGGLQDICLSNAQHCSELEAMLQMVYATMEQQLAEMPLEHAEARAEAAEEEALLQASAGSVLSATPPPRCS